MRLLLINPTNPIVSIVNVKESRWNRFRVWKPLSLMTIAGLTPTDWDVTIVDENLGLPDYWTMPQPDLVGITAFTSQANRAYEIAAYFEHLGVPVVMGGIHATMCTDEALEHVASVVTGEAESIWPDILADVKSGNLKTLYTDERTDLSNIPPPRHDLLPPRYPFGSIQTTRGCPLDCNFCSVTAFNGTHYRQRPIADVVQEFSQIQEKRVLVVDDNLIGTRPEHIDRAKELFRALADANLGKEWVSQATINFADDEELLTLAEKAGCKGVFVGFETPSTEGLKELGKRFNYRKQRDFRASVKRIQKHKILVVGSFIIGLDVDEPGIGVRIAQTASEYGVDTLNALFLTPLPGTRLWDQMAVDDRITRHNFPDDWQYFTLSLPVAKYKHFSEAEVMTEMTNCYSYFYSLPRMFKRIWDAFWCRRQPLISFVGNFSFRRNIKLDTIAFNDFARQGDRATQPALDMPFWPTDTKPATLEARSQV